jgi:hypothetical protein
LREVKAKVVKAIPMGEKITFSLAYKKQGQKLVREICLVADKICVVLAAVDIVLLLLPTPPFSLSRRVFLL